MATAAINSLFGAHKPASSWTPASLTGVVDYWDASDAASITSSGGAVSAWAGQLGIVTLGQSSAGEKPTTASRTLNSKNVIDFDGSTDFLSASLSTSSADWSVLAVVRADSTISGNAGVVVLWGANDDYADNSDLIGMFYSSGAYTFYQAGRTQSPSAGYSTDTAYNSVIVVGASAQANYKNGSANGTASNSMTTPAPSQLYVGCRFYGGSTHESFDGFIAELALCSAVVSAGDIASWSAYTSAKWGV